MVERHLAKVDVAGSNPVSRSLMARFFGYFVEIITSSINPLFYRKVVQRSALSALVYYFLFTTLHSVAVSGVGVWWLHSRFSPALGLAQNFIPDITLGVRQGEFYTNLPQPFSVGDHDFPILMDPNGTSNDLSRYPSGVLITRTFAVVKRSAFETRTFSFSAVPDFRLTSDQVLSFLSTYRDTIAWSLFVFLGLGLLPLAWLFFIPAILIFAIPTWIFAQLLRSRLGFGQTVAILCYTVTLPTLLATYAAFRGTPIPGLFFLVYGVWSVIAVIAARTAPQVPSSSISSSPSGAVGS